MPQGGEPAGGGGLAEAPPSDAADALAVALCHGNLRATLARLARAGAREAR